MIKSVVENHLGVEHNRTFLTLRGDFEFLPTMACQVSPSAVVRVGPGVQATCAARAHPIGTCILWPNGDAVGPRLSRLFMRQ